MYGGNHVLVLDAPAILLVLNIDRVCLPAIEITKRHTDHKESFACAENEHVFAADRLQPLAIDLHETVPQNRSTVPYNSPEYFLFVDLDWALILYGV